MPNEQLFAVTLAVTDQAIAQGIPIPDELDAAVTLTAKTQRSYERALMQTVEDRYNGETSDDEFLALMALLIAYQLRRAMRDGMREVGWRGDVPNDMENEFALMEMEEEQYTRSLLSDILIAIAAGVGIAVLRSRMKMWANRYMDVRNRAMVLVGKRTGALLRWDFGGTEKHCTDCAGYNGTVRTAEEWDDLYRMQGHKPQSRELECKGYNCDCSLNVVRGKG